MDIRGPIDNQHAKPGQMSPLRRPIADAGSPDRRDSDDTAANSLQAERLHAPQIVWLRNQLQKQPEVREAVVQQVSARLAAGEYLTRETAERTAVALLGN